MLNLILNATNDTLNVTGMEAAGNAAVSTLTFLPIGTTGASATGELGVKVHVISGSITADSEFATAAALNGTWAKTTVSTISGAAVMANDGTNLVLIGGEATNGLDVDVTRLPALPAGANTIGAVTNTALSDFGAGEYETVAASQTDQVLGATGAIGDYLSGLLIIPATTSPGGVSIEDGATNIPVFVGGAGSVSNLVPFFVPLGIKSTAGGWEITTGADVSVIGIGNFT